MNTKLSFDNSKMGSLIPSVSISRAESCRPDAPCKKGCYANKGTFNYKNVKAAYGFNLYLYQNYPDLFFDSIIKQLNGLAMYKYFRWHVAGDIVDYNYLLGIVKVAKKTPQTKFLVFTKKYEIVNEYISGGGKIPKNLNIVFSHWDSVWEPHIENPYNLGGTYVRFKDENKNVAIPKKAKKCSGFCEECLGCWTLKKGASVYFDKH